MTEEEMQEYFPKVFPKIFSGKYGGIAVGKGWFDILNSACTLIQSHLDWKPEIPQVEAQQVKEKFGALRFYVQGGDDYTQGIIAMAEQMSGKVCEECGAPGESRSGGWVRTLCDTHEKERQERLATRLAKQDGLEL